MSLNPLKTDTKRIWIRIDDEDRRRTDALLAAFPYMKEAPLVSTLLSAALRACEREGFRTLPKEFAISEDPPAPRPAAAPVRYNLNDKGKK